MLTNKTTRPLQSSDYHKDLFTIFGRPEASENQSNHSGTCGIGREVRCSLDQISEDLPRFRRPEKHLGPKDSCLPHGDVAG